MYVLYVTNVSYVPNKNRHANSCVISYANLIPMLLVNTFDMLMSFFCISLYGCVWTSGTVSPNFVLILHFPIAIAANGLD